MHFSFLAANGRKYPSVEAVVRDLLLGRDFINESFMAPGRYASYRDVKDGDTIEVYYDNSGRNSVPTKSAMFRRINGDDLEII